MLPAGLAGSLPVLDATEVSACRALHADRCVPTTPAQIGTGESAQHAHKVTQKCTDADVIDGTCLSQYDVCCGIWRLLKHKALNFMQWLVC